MGFRTGQLGSTLSKFPKLHGKGIDHKQPAHERASHTQNPLHSLGRLDAAHQAGHETNHTCLGTTGRSSAAESSGLKTTVTWPHPKGNSRYFFETENGAYMFGLPSITQASLARNRAEKLSVQSCQVIFLEDREGHF